MKQGIIIFDFDDTLVSTNPLFEKARLKFALFMEELGLSDKNLLATANLFDIQLVKEYGYFAKECFPLSLVKTYEHYCTNYGKKTDAELRQTVYNIGMWVFEQKPKIFPGAQKVLKSLITDYRMVLLTKGDEDHQKSKILSSGLEKFFLEYYIVPDKNILSFKKIILKHCASPQKSWSIGNSIKADINPAIKLGMQGILIQRPTWDFEHEELVAETYKTQNLEDIPKIIFNSNNRVNH